MKSVWGDNYANLRFQQFPIYTCVKTLPYVLPIVCQDCKTLKGGLNRKILNILFLPTGTHFNLCSLENITKR